MRQDLLDGAAMSDCAPCDPERRLDEALDETFPASDPVAAIQPGSTVAVCAASPAERELNA